MVESVSQASSAELRAAIDVAKARVKVDTYYPKAMNAGLKGNAQGFWSGTALGFFTGGIAGGLVSVGLSLAAIGSPLIGLPLVLGLAGIGGTMGGATGARVGAGSGAIAGVAAERERRDKADALEKEILNSPEKQRAAIEEYRKNPVVEKNDTLGEIVATSENKGKAFGKVVDWKTMLVAVAICSAMSMALFGGMFLLAGGAEAVAAATAAAQASGQTFTGLASGLGALGMTGMTSALLIGAGTGAATGISFGIAYPPIFAGLTKGVADLLSQKMVRGESNFTKIQTAQEMQQEAAKNRAISEPLSNVVSIKPSQAQIPFVSADQPSNEISHVVAAERVAQQAAALSQ